MKVLSLHLYLRNGHIYYRQALPPALRPVFKRREFVISLRTKNLAQARLIAANIDVHYANFKAAYMGITYNQQITPEQQKAALSQFHEVILPYMKPTPKRAPLPPKSKLFSDVWPDYLKTCKSNYPKTIKGKQTTFEKFQDKIGNMPIDSITKAEAKTFIESLLQSQKEFSISTINTRIGNLCSLFQWLENTGDRTQPNPFTGLKLRESKDKRGKRSSFNKREIETIFTSPIYTGSIGQQWAYRLEKGENIYRDSLYWVPFIAYYSGMRLNEICQLYLDDIQVVDNIPFFDLNNKADKRLKTGSSQRKVPIHQALIDMGLLDHVQTLRDSGQTRLFEDLPAGPYGNYGFYFSKKFTQLLIRLKLKRPGLCFHSFRHTFIDSLKEAGVERPIAMAICGHDSGKSAHDFYGSGYNIKTLSKEINRISPM